MSKDKRNVGALISAVALLALVAILVAACVPITDPRLSAGDSPLAQPATTAVEAADPSAEVVQDASSSAETVAEAATPSVITHSVLKRPECLDCHEAETGRNPSPANHRAMTEAVCLYCHMSEDEEVAVPPLPAVADVEFCLGCHGPFEELAARTEAAFVVKGVEANPHMYVPHTSTNVFNCKNCHEVHDLPVIAPMEIQQADLGYCYLSCHHEEDFTPCISCHSGDDE
jgi:hypothetical protein